MIFWYWLSVTMENWATWKDSRRKLASVLKIGRISCNTLLRRVDYRIHPPSILCSTNLQVLSNLVNYKSFGFTKIIPRISATKFEATVKASANSSEALALWKEVSYRIQWSIISVLTTYSPATRTYLCYRTGRKSLHRKTQLRPHLKLLPRATYRRRRSRCYSSCSRGDRRRRD